VIVESVGAREIIKAEIEFANIPYFVAVNTPGAGHTPPVSH